MKLIEALDDIKWIGNHMPRHMYLFIPFIVMDELNGILNSEKRSKLRTRIRTFRDFILTDKPEWLVLQTVGALGPQLRARCNEETVNDDKIVIIYQALMHCPMKTPILLSGDLFLNIKISNIEGGQGLCIQSTKPNTIVQELFSYDS